MLDSLQKKFLLLYTIILLIIYLILNYYTFPLLEEDILKKKIHHLQKEAMILTNQYINSYETGTMDLIDINNLIHILDQSFDAHIWFVNKDGVVVADSRETPLTKGFSIKDFSPSLLYQPFSMIGDFYGYFDTTMISVGSPVTIQNTLMGSFIFHSKLKDIEKNLAFNKYIAMMTALLITTLSFILIHLVTRKIVKPLKTMNEVASRYANGEFVNTLHVKSNDEIGKLANSLNNMAYELSKLEEFRRSFIANISHDIRSPLTSIKGYVSAIADGTIPVDQQEKYLTIVLDETERLNKLTSDILLLTTMENQGLNLHYTTFDIHKVLRKIVSSFEQKCLEKHIEVTLTLANKQLLVYADIDRIQQVLYNLFDNAVKFSYSHGSITLETTESQNHIYVSIKDLGMGIPKENLKYIWDRFYKSDASRGIDRKGTGLGLSIVREILKAHNETIRVYSTKGIGTEFIFTLSKPQS